MYCGLYAILTSSSTSPLVGSSTPASILAKVSRDRYMEELDAKYPQYNWKENAGYLTKEHMSLIDKYGLSPHHRPSYLKKHFAKQEQLNMF